MDLMSSREVGMGLGPIWWGTVQNYCEKKGLEAEQTEEMHYHIRAMDLAYLKHMDKKSGGKGGKSTPIQSKHKKKG